MCGSTKHWLARYGKIWNFESPTQISFPSVPCFFSTTSILKKTLDANAICVMFKLSLRPDAKNGIVDLLKNKKHFIDTNDGKFECVNSSFELKTIRFTSQGSGVFSTLVELERNDMNNDSYIRYRYSLTDETKEKEEETEGEWDGKEEQMKNVDLKTEDESDEVGSDEEDEETKKTQKLFEKYDKVVGVTRHINSKLVKSFGGAKIHDKPYWEYVMPAKFFEEAKAKLLEDTILVKLH